MEMWHSGTWVSDGLGSAGLTLGSMILKVVPTLVILACLSSPMIPYGTELTMSCPEHIWLVTYSHGLVPESIC